MGREAGNHLREISFGQQPSKRKRHFELLGLRSNGTKSEKSHPASVHVINERMNYNHFHSTRFLLQGTAAAQPLAVEMTCVLKLRNPKHLNLRRYRSEPSALNL